MRTVVVDHPLAAERLTVLRDKRTDRATFRQAMSELASMLVYEAWRSIAVEPVTVTTPLGPAAGVRLSRPPLVVPVLRAGLGMVDAALRLVPGAEVGFVGVARDEATHQPHPYMTKLEARLAGRPLMVLDPMLATGGSLEYTCRLLAERGAGRQTVVCVLSAPEGLTRMEASGLDVEVVTAAIDERLNDDAFIVPGLGDAGDRLFGLS